MPAVAVVGEPTNTLEMPSATGEPATTSSYASASIASKVTLARLPGAVDNAASRTTTPAPPHRLR